MKIRAYLVLMAVAILAPVLIFSTVALNMLQSAEHDAVMRALHETARATALAVDKELTSSEAALRVLAASPTLAEGDLKNFYEQAKTVDRGPNAWTVLFDNQGQQLINTFVPYGSPLPSPIAKDRVQQAIKTKRTFVSNLVIGALTKRAVTSVNVPSPIENGEKYVVAQIYDASHFGRILSNSRIPSSWIVAIIDREGRFVARSRRAEELVGQFARPEVVRASRMNAEGQLRHLTLEGVESNTVFTRSALSGWTIAVAAPVADIEVATRQAIWVMLLGMLAAASFATIAALLFGKRLILSIAHAFTSAAALAKGKLPEPSHFGVTEVDHLHMALQKAGAILQSEKESRQKAESEREQLLASEQKARQLAEEQNKAKDKFLAMLGHELRNPLSAISAGIEVIKQAGVSSPMSARAHEIIERQSGHLERIVGDLLDAGRMLAGKINLVKSPLDLSNAAKVCLQALEASGRLKQHRISFTAKPAWINADPARIDQIINNLLINAVKYTPSGGLIHITVGVEEGEALLRVSDTGVGMTSELMARIFEPFVQGESSLDRAQGGLGIGLTMVRELVKLHGGMVNVSSQGNSRGSEFIITLPLILPSDEITSPDSSQEQHRKYRILLIEDNDDARDMTLQMLALSQHQAMAAPNGMEGLRLAKEENPDVAIIDIGLPDMSGYEVAKRLRADQETSGMILIALTGYGLAADIQQALEAGFDMHLTKPVNGHMLKQAIEHCAATSSA